MDITEFADYLRCDSELEKKENELILEAWRRAQAKRKPSTVVGHSSLKVAALWRLSIAGPRGLTPKELYRDRLLLKEYAGERLSPRVETYSMCLSRLGDEGYAEKVKEGRTRRYYRSLVGLGYLLYVLKRKEHLQAQKAEWERANEMADLAFTVGKAKITSMERTQLKVDKFPEIIGSFEALRVLSPLIKTLRDAAGDISLVQLFIGHCHGPEAQNVISHLTCWSLDKLESLASQLFQAIIIMEALHMTRETSARARLI